MVKSLVCGMKLLPRQLKETSRGEVSKDKEEKFPTDLWTITSIVVTIVDVCLEI